MDHDASPETHRRPSRVTPAQVIALGLIAASIGWGAWVLRDRPISEEVELLPGTVLPSSELAIVEALKAGKLYGVGVDVLVGENADNFSSHKSPLVRAISQNLNVVVSPHIGGWTEQAVATTRTLVVEELLRHL